MKVLQYRSALFNSKPTIMLVTSRDKMESYHAVSEPLLALQ